MARKSRKHNAEKIGFQGKTNEKKIYKTGIYARLSREDGESNSISNQLELMKKYIHEHPDLTMVGRYIDDGYTGTKMDRPEFQRMISDMRGGKINCIVVKDLSRFGRNFLEVSNYLENIFPFFQVRFISVTDGYDNLNTQEKGADLIIPLKNLMNEYYAKDISSKLCSSLKMKQCQGKFIGSQAPYGYIKDPLDKHHLIVDEEVKDVIIKIFRWKERGEGNCKIARRLNEAHISSPMKYRYEKGIVANERFKDMLWGSDTIRHILDNPVYVGDMAQGTERTALHSGRRTKKVPREEWIIVPNTHKPIISREQYTNVRKLVDQTKEFYKDNRKEERGKKDCFQGIVVCGQCNHRMYLKRTSRKVKDDSTKIYENYVCKRLELPHRNLGKKKSINKRELEKLVSITLKIHMDIYLDTVRVLQLLSETDSVAATKKKGLAEIKKVKNQIEKAKERKTSLYEDYVDGILNEQEYLLMRKKRQNDMKEYTEKLKKLSERYNEYPEEENSATLELVEKYRAFEKITPEIVQAFIKKIVIHSRDQIHIFFKFDDELERMTKEIKKGAWQVEHETRQSV